MAVHPAHQHQGIGSALVRHAIAPPPGGNVLFPRATPMMQSPGAMRQFHRNLLRQLVCQAVVD